MSNIYPFVPPKHKKDVEDIVKQCVPVIQGGLKAKGIFYGDFTRWVLFELVRGYFNESSHSLQEATPKMEDFIGALQKQLDYWKEAEE